MSQFRVTRSRSALAWFSKKNSCRINIGYFGRWSTFYTLVRHDKCRRVLPLYNTWKRNPALVWGMRVPVAGPPSEEFSHKLQNRTCNLNRETGPLQVRWGSSPDSRYRRVRRTSRALGQFAPGLDRRRSRRHEFAPDCRLNGRKFRNRTIWFDLRNRPKCLMVLLKDAS